VAAVVVKPGPTPQFGVVAVHARTPATVHWVVPLDTQVINGVAKGSRRDTVTPLYCVECDSNTWFRWSGRSYEASLHAVGEQLLRAEDTTYRKNQPLGLFAKPTRDSKFLFPIDHCKAAIVLQVAGSEKNRWSYARSFRNIPPSAPRPRLQTGTGSRVSISANTKAQGGVESLIVWSFDGTARFHKRLRDGARTPVCVRGRQSVCL
jgi:hypothetical protein